MNSLHCRVIDGTMKKKYLKPEVVNVDFCAVTMLAASKVEEIPIKPGEGGSAGVNKERGEWGNLWSR